MKTLVTVKTFSKMTGLSTVEVYNMIKPQRIRPRMIDGKPFIDLNEYNPKNFKK
jgi:predicted DNA-binding transcriptional regulator AlpA